MNDNDRGLYVSIYRDARLGDCTMNGITSLERGHKEVFLLNAFGPFTVAEAKQRKMPIVAIGVAGGCKHVRPVFDGEKEVEGMWAFGGNIVYSSDSRFPNDYPLKVHDRNMRLEHN